MNASSISIRRAAIAALLTVAIAVPSMFEAAEPDPVATPSAIPSTGASDAPSAASADAARLAVIKESQNPVGNIAVIPFQSNWNTAYGPFAREQYNLNVQPVVPFEISPSLNLVSRTIIPLVDQPSTLSPTACASPSGCPWTIGLGNVQEQLYFAPRTRPGGVIWGAGPIFILPTETPASLGSSKTSVGPTAVALTMPGPFVIGLLANQAWSVMGPSSAAPVSTFFAEPFVNYNVGKGWALVSAPGTTANWNAPGSNKWTVPMGLGVLKTFKLGQQLQQAQIAYYTNVVRPIDGAYGQWRFQWSLLYPVKRHR